MACYAIRKNRGDLFSFFFTSEPCIQVGVQAAMPPCKVANPSASTKFLIALVRDHTVRFFAQFVCIKNFGPITSRHYFLEKLLARRKHFVFSAKKLLKVSHVFFHCKSISQLLRNLFEICHHGGCSILRFVELLIFLVRQNALKKWKMPK